MRSGDQHTPPTITVYNVPVPCTTNVTDFLRHTTFQDSSGTMRLTNAVCEDSVHVSGYSRRSVTLSGDTAVRVALGGHPASGVASGARVAPPAARHRPAEFGRSRVVSARAAAAVHWRLPSAGRARRDTADRGDSRRAHDGLCDAEWSLLARVSTQGAFIIFYHPVIFCPLQHIRVHGGGTRLLALSTGVRRSLRIATDAQRVHECDCVECDHLDRRHLHSLSDCIAFAR